MGEARRKAEGLKQAAWWLQGDSWVSTGRLDLLEVLVEQGFDLNTRDPFSGSTLLHMAAQGGHDVVLKWLIAKGADTGIFDTQENDAMQLAVVNGHHGCVEALVEAGVDVNRDENGGVTLLMEAARWGRQECLDLLIRAGANVEARTGNGLTALMCAAMCPYQGNPVCVEKLVEAGADWETANKDGITAEKWAANPESKVYLAGLRVAKRAHRLEQALPTVGAVDNHQERF